MNQNGKRYVYAISDTVKDILELNAKSAIPIDNLLRSHSVNLIEETVKYVSHLILDDPDKACSILFPYKTSHLKEDRSQLFQRILWER